MPSGSQTGVWEPVTEGLHQILPANKMDLSMSSQFFEANEILNIYKPAGWTSFDVVKKIRGLSNIKKVGHAGTLDPFAEGVLLLALGKATKRISELMNLPKEYVAEIKLGEVTDTLDSTGKLVQTKPIEHLSIPDVKKVCREFIGTIDQIPPAYSAIKVAGVRAYRLARKGVEVKLKPRKVTISELEILKIQLPQVKIRVTCSKGTYLRALARDIGEKLNTGGHLTALVRTRIGTYQIEDSLTIDEIANRKIAAI